MSRTTIYLLLVAVGAIVATLWYRQTVFPEKVTPSSIRLAFVTGGSGPFWQMTASGARAAAEKYDCKLEVKMPEDDENLEQQMTILTGLDVEQLDGIALSPLDSDGQTRLINRLQQNVNVATYDADAPLSIRRIHVGTSNYGAGKLCAELVAEAVPDGGKILVLLANLTKDNMIDRKSGLEESLALRAASSESEESGPEFTIVEILTDDGEQKKTEENIQKTLDAHSDLACIVGMNAQHGPIIQSVLEDAKRIGEIKIVAFDDQKETLDGIEAGHVYATVAQDPYMYGFDAVRMLCSVCREGESEVPIVGGGTKNISTEAIRQRDLSDYKSRLEARLAKKSQ